MRSALGRVPVGAMSDNRTVDVWFSDNLIRECFFHICLL